MSDYISTIRSKIGQDLLLHPAARIIIENEAKEFLFILRKDNHQWGIPAGALEANESIEACIRREVKEETGIEILALEVIGISSQPKQELVQYPNGDQVQYCTIEFYSKTWKGNLNADGIETKIVEFQTKDTIDQLPLNEKSTFESLAYYRRTGKVLLK